MSKRMKKDHLYIGVHHLHSYAHTEQHVRDVADAGVEFVVELNQGYRKTFDLFHKYGIGVIVTDVIPKWGGPGYGYIGRMEEKFPRDVYEQGVQKFKDHPAIWGLLFCDEPNAMDFKYMGEMVDYVNRNSANQFAYLNLYPNYALTCRNTESQIQSQLGTESYEQYIEDYCKYIPTDYISFDYYAYGRGLRYSKDEPNEGIAFLYENLRVVADACRKTGRSLWFIGQVNSYFPEVFTTTNQIRFQAFAAMAFGVEVIQWGCYTTGWWTNQILDADGNKTEQYEKMKKVNWEVRAMADEYMKYRNTATHFVGFKNSPDVVGLNQEILESLNTGVFFDVKADNDASLVIGQMVSKSGDGSQALMILAADDSHDLGGQSYNINFRANKGAVNAFGGEGRVPVTKLEDGSYSVPICSNAGVLITID
ncbi:MAG: hypothetical protein E7658_08480 [Ruminococcaceae bacterium]|nr:hypothetical protein [Oscillospiraceae bacterium]